MKHKHSLPRWQLETHNDKRGVWQHEATWHDGENARGTPRLERAMKEGRDLMDAGETVRIVDLRTGYAHYPNEWDGMVPNVQGQATGAALCDRSAAPQGSASEPHHED